MFERVHSYVKRTIFPFVRIGKFRKTNTRKLECDNHILK